MHNTSGTWYLVLCNPDEDRPTGLQAASTRTVLPFFLPFQAVSWPAVPFLRLILRPEMRNSNQRRSRDGCWKPQPWTCTGDFALHEPEMTDRPGNRPQQEERRRCVCVCMCDLCVCMHAVNGVFVLPLPFPVANDTRPTVRARAAARSGVCRRRRRYQGCCCCRSPTSWRADRAANEGGRGVWVRHTTASPPRAMFVCLSLLWTRCAGTVRRRKS